MIAFLDPWQLEDFDQPGDHAPEDTPDIPVTALSYCRGEITLASSTPRRSASAMMQSCLHRPSLQPKGRNGLAGSAGAAPGSLHPDADRPLPRPPGQIPRRCRGASRALRVPARPPAAALD